jgi:hypothetical protein
MAKQLSAQAQQRIESLVQARRNLDRIHNLVEQYASARKGQDTFASMIARTAVQLSRLLLNNGFGVMADHANQIGLTAKRGGATQSKFRGLREGVGSLRGELERSEKSVLADERHDDAESSS